MPAERFAFVDRDGTLIEDRGFVHRIEDYAPLAGAADALRLLIEGGYRIAIVTNQSGIGRGFFSEAQYAAFDAHLRRDFEARGASIEASYHCPHTAEDGCSCRKPAPGLLERAVRELGASLTQSFVIGDKPSDMELAARAGCRGVYVLTGHGEAQRHNLEGPLPVEADLRGAALHILRRERV